MTDRTHLDEPTLAELACDRQRTASASERAHLRACSRCRTVYDHYRRLSVATGALPRQVEPMSLDAWRIMERGASRIGVSAPQQVNDGAAERRIGLAARPRWRTHMWRLGAAASLLIVAFVAGRLSATPRGGIDAALRAGNAPNEELRASFGRALDVQAAGSAYLDAIAALRNATDGERRQAQSSAMATIYGAALELQMQGATPRSLSAVSDAIARDRGYELNTYDDDHENQSR